MAKDLCVRRAKFCYYYLRGKKNKKKCLSVVRSEFLGFLHLWCTLVTLPTRAHRSRAVFSFQLQGYCRTVLPKLPPVVQSPKNRNQEYRITCEPNREHNGKQGQQQSTKALVNQADPSHVGNYCYHGEESRDFALVRTSCVRRAAIFATS